MKVKSVKKSIKRLTVDMEVAETHSYQLDNGCITHNTVSQLVDAASGIHARHNDYYIRTVRSDMKDPLSDFMIAQGFPHEPDQFAKDSTWVFSFPMKVPNDSVTRKEISAIDQLKIWKTYQVAWCEHKPSVTISVKDEEWPEVFMWVYKNWEWMSGISFLPFDDHVYPQAPYQDCSKKEYEELLAKMPQNVVWSDLSKYETGTDTTTGSQELACSGPSGCEI